MTDRPIGPRDKMGRFIKRDCPDPNCSGQLSPDRDQGWWHCDGLTFSTIHEPLRVCEHSHCDGHEVSA